MADFYYKQGVKNIGLGLVNFSTDTFKVVLVRETGGTPYVPVQNTDEFLSDIPVGARTATTPALVGTWSSGPTASYVYASADSVLPTVTGVVDSLVLYKDTGTAATSPLIARLDVVTGLPYTGAGSSVTIQYPTGANKLYKVG